MINLNELPPSPENRKKANRVGRGIGSGNGKTAGRGQKGQKARAGGYHKVGFEGGQMPLQRRLPKRGFNNIFRKIYALVNVGDLDRFESGTEVTAALLQESGLVRKNVGAGIKLLGQGTLTKNLNVVVDKASGTAKEKVEQAGGTVTLNA